MNYMNKNKLSGLLVVAVLLSVLALGISVSAQADDGVVPPTLELLVTPDGGGVSTSSFDYSVLPAAMQTIITDSNEGYKIDIKEVNADLSPAGLTVNVALYTSVTSGTLAFTWFDLDQNPSTGITDADAPGYGLNDIGADYYMQVYKGYTNALVIDLDTGDYTEVPVSWTSNSFTVIIPLSALGNDDGYMDVTQLAGEDGMYLADCDIAPDQGHGTVSTSNCTLVISQITLECPKIDAIVAVTDPQGPVTGLTESDFTVEENGNAISPITVTPLAITQKPLDVALTLDGSGSMSSTDKANAKAAANAFVNLMSTNDQGAVIGFAENIIVKEHLTNDKAKLHNAIDTYETGLYTGATSLYDAIVVSVDEVASSTNVRAVLVMTDGKNNYGSHTMQSAIDHANKYSVPVYTIGLGSADQSVLQQIAVQTGGKYYYAPSSSELTQIYQELAKHIYSQYLVTWNTILTGSPATINVEIDVSCGGSDIRTYPVCPPNGTCVVWIDDVNAPPGGTATESIMLAVNDFGSATIELMYDPTIVQVQSVSQGDCGAVFENIDNANGKTIISSQGTGAIPGPSGTLEFAEIGFKAVGSVGECSPLNLNVVTLAHTDGSAITPATACDGEFCITQSCRICGDVNCDCKVDIVDAMFIAQYTVGNRNTPCDPCPDPYPCASSCGEESLMGVEGTIVDRVAAARQSSLKDKGDMQSSAGLATADLNSGLTPSNIANELVGGGVTISNVVYSGNNVAVGKFSGGTGIIGFEEGIILSSGDIANVVGPNSYDGTTNDNGMPGDADLGALIPGYTTYDAAVLEFDFVPDSNVVTFEYVFGSEEYNEFVDSSYNDVFGFFINGVNCALIPGTSTAVSINNVNGGNPYGTNPTNPAYYRNNDLDDGGGSINTELDGLTVVLTVTAIVNAGKTNHLKLAIADAGDYVLDSDVFIKAKSITAYDLTLKPLTDTNPVGSSHTLTATLVDATGNPASGTTITFTITNGPHVGLTGTDVTDVNGHATWSYTGTTAGTDIIVATGAGKTSNAAYKTWEGGCVVWIDDVSTSPGGTAIESIILNVDDFGSATIELTYDPTIVQVQSVSQGDCGAVFENIDNANGKTIISSQGTGAIPGPSGTLEFAEIGFKAVGSVGECSPLNLNVVTLAHTDGSAITPATACDGEFCITQSCRICGDVNCDCKVDIVDAMFIAQYTVGNRPTPCDPCPDPYPCACGGDGGPLSGLP